MDTPTNPPTLAVDTSSIGHQNERSLPGHALTARAIGCGIILGSAVCFANTYFGLQAGIVNAMPMQSALLGFALFRAIQHRLSKSLSPKETTTIEIVAGALGLAPFTSGFTAFIPALEFYTTSKEGGPVKLSTTQLILWSIATCGLGIVVAAPFRHLFIIREKLRFPSATATGTLIGLLFGDETIISRANQEEKAKKNTDTSPGGITPESSLAEHRNSSDRLHSVLFSDSDSSLGAPNVEVALRVLLLSLAFSSFFSLVAYFVPTLNRLPLFGFAAATKWLWAFDLSPAYFGYGIIIGPSTNAYTLLGAIIGWGILSPLAKHRGWAPGPVKDWDNGSRGWILWVGMGLILGDSLIGLSWFIFKPFALEMWRQARSRALQRSSQEERDRSAREPLLEEDSLPPHSHSTEGSVQTSDSSWPKSSRITSPLIVLSGIVVLLACFLSLLLGFRKLVAPIASVVAVLLVIPASFVSMRSLGETDYGASLAIGRVAQLLIGLMVPSSHSNYMSANLLLSGLVESGASQASQHMGGQKTAYITDTAPRAVFYGQMIGSLIGTLIATLAYRLYTTFQEFPNKKFDVPDAHVWLVAARFIHQQGLPDKALGFSIASFVVGSGLSVLRIVGRPYWWCKLVPSGVAMAIGMYVVPAITLPRALGSLILVVCQKVYGVKYFVLLCCATGLILGQGLFSVVSIVMGIIFTPRK